MNFLAIINAISVFAKTHNVSQNEAIVLHRHGVALIRSITLIFQPFENLSGNRKSYYTGRNQLACQNTRPGRANRSERGGRHRRDRTLLLELLNFCFQNCMRFHPQPVEFVRCELNVIVVPKTDVELVIRVRRSSPNPNPSD